MSTTRSAVFGRFSNVVMVSPCSRRAPVFTVLPDVSQPVSGMTCVTLVRKPWGPHPRRTDGQMDRRALGGCGRDRVRGAERGRRRPPRRLVPQDQRRPGDDRRVHPRSPPCAGRRGALPSWYASLALAAGVSFCLGGLTVREDGFFAVAGPMTLIAFVTLMVWALTTSVVLWRVPRATPG